MARESDRDRPAPAPVSSAPWAQELKGAIDGGRTGKKVAFSDLGAAPLGTDDEAAGTPDTAVRVATAMRQELKQCRSRTRPRPPRDVLNRVGDHRDRLHSWVQRIVVFTRLHGGRIPPILPHIGSVTTVLAELDRLPRSGPVGMLV